MKYADYVKNYLAWIRYKLILKKRHDRVIKESKDLKTKVDLKLQELKDLKDLELKTIGYIDHLKDPNKSLELKLYSKQIYKMNWFKEIIFKIFKFDGYIIYLNKADDIKIYKVKDLRFLHKIKNRELYGLKKKIGTLNGKPAFLVKYPYTISLELKNKNAPELFYDPESFNNYVDKATKINLTNLGNNFNLMEFIKQNFILILIAVALIFLFFTPEGKQFLGGLLPK